MAATIPTTRSDFVSSAQRCAAWLTLPDGPGPHPAVVLAHGLGATHEMMLAQYEQHFAASGIATLAFDYLHTGASEGAPRQRFSIPGQCRDLHAALNRLRALRRGARHYVPIVGPPGSRAMVTVPGAESGWYSTVPPGYSFDNRIAAADMAGVVLASGLRHARRISAPLLVCVCDRENLMDPKYAELVATRAPQGVARHYDSDHFAIYHPPLVDRVLADQTAFLTESLDVRA